MASRPSRGDQRDALTRYGGLIVGLFAMGALGSSIAWAGRYSRHLDPRSRQERRLARALTATYQTPYSRLWFWQHKQLVRAVGADLIAIGDALERPARSEAWLGEPFAPIADGRLGITKTGEVRAVITTPSGLHTLASPDSSFTRLDGLTAESIISKVRRLRAALRAGERIRVWLGSEAL